MLHLEIKHLRLVIAIADLGNLTRAAHVLCLSQPALSKQLAELEAQLGFALFHRTRKGMAMTDPGRSFRQHSETIVNALGLLEAELERHGNGALGKLRVAIDRVHHCAWLPAVMAQFRQRHPRITLEIKQVPQLLDSLQQRAIDLAIIGEALDASGVEYVPLQADEMLAVLPRAHPLCEKTFIGAHDLAGVDLIYYFALEQSYLFRRYLRPHRIELGAFHHVEHIDAIIELVKCGQGITILPAGLIRHVVGVGVGADALVLRPIGPLGFKFTWFAATASEAEHPYAAAFVGLLKAHLAGASGMPAAVV